jgi:hypothetical protein
MAFFFSLSQLRCGMHDTGLGTGDMYGLSLLAPKRAHKAIFSCASQRRGYQVPLSRPAAQRNSFCPNRRALGNEKKQKTVQFGCSLCMAGPGNDPVQVYRTKLRLHWEFLRLWTGFELPSSWSALPRYGANRKRNILDFMRWPQIDLGAQDLNDIKWPKSFSKK